MPEPTEESILSRTLLAPSALPTILPLQDFANLFPTSQRAHPQIKVLYRDLQHRRNLDLDYVKQNVVSEARRGEHQRRELAKTRWRDAKGDRRALDLDLEDDAAMREDGMEGLVCYWRTDTMPSSDHNLALWILKQQSGAEATLSCYCCSSTGVGMRRGRCRDC
jgi:hypothetical protein